MPRGGPPPDLKFAKFKAGEEEMLVVSFSTEDGRLSSAEQAVVAAIFAGKSNADIAKERGTSVRTVANQVASIFRKLGVKSRAQLVAMWDGRE